MKLSLYSAAVAAALFAATSQAVDLKQNRPIEFSQTSAESFESFVERISELELSQAEAATMTEAEIMARAEVIADTFLDAMVEGEVSAEARAEFVSKIGSSLTKGIS